MESKELYQKVDKGKIAYPDRMVETSTLTWNDHPRFKGVKMKNLITGKDTGGLFSCHLIKIEKVMEIGEHIHEGKWELHEVIEGYGTCILADKELLYEPGILTVIPEGIKHRVIAGEQGLKLWAKFVPPLE